MSYYRGDEEELDLHGYRTKEALELFIQVYNRHAGKSSPLVVVHGYGSSGEGGKIRRRLRRMLDRYPGNLDYERGEKVGNPGITIVFPKKPLPTAGDRLEQEILAYCSKPRTREKIAGRFRKHGQPKVLDALRKLERKGMLENVSCGRYRCYRAVS